MNQPWETITVVRAGYTYTVEYLTDDDADNPRDAFDNASFLVTWDSRQPRFDTDTGTHAAAVAALRHFFDRYWHTDTDHILRALDIWRAVTASPDRLFYGTYGPLSYYSIAPTADIAHDEAREFGQWAAGEVYGYHLIDPDGTVIDDCWGFLRGGRHARLLVANWRKRTRAAAIERREHRRQARSAGAGLIGVI